MLGISNPLLLCVGAFAPITPEPHTNAREAFSPRNDTLTLVYYLIGS